MPKIKDIVIEYGKHHPGGWNTNPVIYKQIKGNNAGCFSLKWLEWNKVCGTLPAAEISLTGIMHPNKKRYLNLQEAKRIGSFPDKFIMLVRDKAWKLIGNSVPPLFMRVIAEFIRSNYLVIQNG